MVILKRRLKLQKKKLKKQLSLNMNNFNNDANLVENINEDLKYADNYFSKKLDNYLNANQDIILIMSERNKRSLNYKAPQYKKYITDLNKDSAFLKNIYVLNILKINNHLPFRISHLSIYVNLLIIYIYLFIKKDGY